MKAPVRLFAKAFLALLVMLIGFAFVYNIIYHGLIRSDWRMRDQSGESEMRLLARVIRGSQLSDTNGWINDVISEYESKRDFNLLDSKSVKERYTFYTGGFVDNELPVILPKTTGKGGYVVYSSGLVVWMTKRQLDESLSIINSHNEE